MGFYNWLENNNKKELIGTCINCLDDSWFTDKFASDATELAGITDENSPDVQKLTLNQFENICNANYHRMNGMNHPDRYEFFVNDSINLAWAYDTEADIHYFYY